MSFEVGVAAVGRGVCPFDCGPLETDSVVYRDNRFALAHTVRIGWCGSCGLGVTLDPPTREQLGQLYEREYTDDEQLAAAGRSPRTSWLARLWHRVNGSLPLSDLPFRAPVLDVGAHTGELLALLESRGIEAVGLEPNPRAVAAARSRGLEVIAAAIEDAELPAARFGTIVLSQVLEHVEDPVAVLAAIRPALMPGGVVYIVVPNVGSAWRSVFGRHWIHWHVPFHLFHHTDRSLARLCALGGFEIRRLRTVTPGEWMLMTLAAWRNARHQRFEIRPFTGRYGRRLLLAPICRLVDALHQGDAFVVEAVVAGPQARQSS